MVEPSPPTVDEATYRLPRSVVPRRYELTIEPDLDAATFAGQEAVEVEITEAVDEIVLNAAELEVDGAWLDIGGERVDLDVRLDADTERLHLGLPRPVGPAEATVQVSFRGVLNDQLRGFYRSTFVDDQGRTRTIGTTQFEATDARRAFPCWDEPDRKAVFAVTLVVADDLLAVSNTEPVRAEPAGPGRRSITFADSIPMSTYLVAFVVGPLEVTDAVDVDGVPLRVVHPPGKGHLTAYPLEVGAFCLRWFTEYYGLPYPGDKLDLIALPDFAAGAMENLGAITFREALLLVDPASVTQAELQRVADVVAHEIAHMWFGDLVTMRWWNGLWLNEAFATFMELAACDAYKPEWQRWVAFSRERAVAFEVDSLASTRPIEYPVHSPDDADGMFDVLTYQKGGSVLRMLEQYLGETRFRAGIRHYLRTRQLANAETTDLFDDIEAATDEPVRSIMDSWVFQGGYPLVTVAPGAGSSVVVTQERLLYTGGDGEASGSGATWAVPLLLRRPGGEPTPVLLDGPRLEVDLAGDGPVVANAGGHGFYRVRYHDELFAALSEQAAAVLEPVERAQLVDDTWAAVLAGQVPARDLLVLAERLRGERHRTVWTALLEGLGQLDHILEGEARSGLQRTVRGLVRPVLDDLGWVPADGEDELTRQLRGTLVQAAGILGDDRDVQDEARSVHERHQAEPGSVDPDVAAAAVRVVAHAGDEHDHARFVERFRHSGSPQEQLRYLYALALFGGDALVERTLDMVLGPEVRTQNAPFLLLGLLQGRASGSAAWRFVCEHWDEINERFPTSAVPRLLGGVTRLSRPEQAAVVEAFLAEHDVPHGRMQVRQHLERLRVNVGLRHREADRLADVLTG